MKKIIQILLILILVLILLLIVIFVFNPLNSRDKIIGGIINNYLENNIEGYAPKNEAPKDEASELTPDAQSEESSADKHPLLNESQEEMLENFGVDVGQLPTEITPGMESCFIEKLGPERAAEIAGGATPGVLEFFKAKDCIGQ